MTTYTWTGANSNDWFDGTNWDTGLIPTLTIDTLFNNSNLAAIASDADCHNFTYANANPLFSITNPGVALNVYGNFTLFAGTNFDNSNGNLTFKSTTTGQTITTAGVSVGAVVFNGVGGGWTFQDALSTFFSGTTYRSVTLTNGAVNTNNQTLTINSFLSTNANVRSLTLGSSTINLTAVSGTVWDFTTITNLTFSAGTSLLKVIGSGSGSKTFIGGGKTYNNLWNATTNAGILIIQGSNTFNNIKSDAGRTIQFTAGTTTTFNSISINGTSSNRTVLQSSGAAYNLVSTELNVNMHYVTISNCHASGATFTAYNSIDGGGNTGITFVANNSVNAWGSNPVSSFLDSSDGNIVITPNGQYIDLKLSRVIRYFNADYSHYVGFQAPALTANTTYTLPSAFPSSTQAFVSDNVGNVSFQSIPVASSGTYTPTLTNTTNVSSSTAYACQYMRVGNVITVSGRIDVTPTLAATDSQLDISLPVVSNFTQSFQCGGAGASAATTNESVALKARPSATTVIMSWRSTLNSAIEIDFSFTYQVI